MSRLVAIRDWLLGSVEIANAITDRAFAGHIPQGVTGTSIVLNQINSNHEYSLTGQIGIIAYTYQIDVYDDGGTPLKTVQEVGELVRNRLSGYRGQLNDDVFCHGAFIEGDSESEDRPIDSSSNWKTRESFDVELHLTAAVPTFS